MFGGYEIGLWSLLAIASITDLIWGKIFNWITLSYFAAGLAFRFWTGGLPAATSSAFAVLVAFLLFFPLYLVKAMAAGDVKLLMAIGAWADTKLVVEIGMLSILIGALVGAFVLVRQTSFRTGLKSLSEHLTSAKPKHSHRMPFAPAFLCAFFFLQLAEKYRWSAF